MRRTTVIGLTGVALLALGAQSASAARGPSERRCLLAWNARDNAANRQRIDAAGPWPRASLFPGVSGTLTWRRGSQPVSTSGPACLLTLVRHTRVQPVTGLWRHGRVSRWSFGGRLTTSRAPGRTNVRVLPDGRVTKVYLR